MKLPFLFIATYFSRKLSFFHIKRLVNMPVALDACALWDKFIKLLFSKCRFYDKIVTLSTEIVPRIKKSEIYAHSVSR